tara:strand:- start:2493 stop:3992 length:1500 start_codon:yes stop_codon:yes gene_type:complete
MSNEKIVVIGKIMDSTPETIDIRYQAASGQRDIRLPRSLITRTEKMTNGRMAVLVETDDSENGELIRNHLGVGEHSPLHQTMEHIMVVDAMEHGEPLPETDDDTPQWEDETTIPTVSVDGGAPQAVPFEDALYSGGRKAGTVDWDFTPVKKPAFVMYDSQDDGAMQGTVARVNEAGGEPAAYHVFNPNLSDDRRPAGAYLGTFSKQYYPMPYREGFGKALELAAENGWSANVMAYNEGKKASLYCDVTSSVTWDDALDANDGFGRRMAERGLFKSGDYRIGFVIHNSLDGSSSFKVQAVAMRLVCSNGMVMGNAADLIRLKHTTGTLKGYDFDGLYEKIQEVIFEAQKELISVDALKSIDVNMNTFEKLMTICQKKGLITKPQVTRDDAGDVTGITRGYMWRLLGQGWTKPLEPWVAVKQEEQGSLFHVYNILTGAITHKPEWTDGKQRLTGRTLGFDTMTDRLKITHSVIMDLAEQADRKGSLDEALEDVPLFSEIVF